MLTQMTLQTDKVRLAPLTREHLPHLRGFGEQTELWTWVLDNYCQTDEKLVHWFEQSAQFDPDVQLPLVIIDQQSNAVAGSTRLFRLHKSNLSAEIGHTFIGQQWQRSHINTHAKYLLLKHAFETLGLVRVQLRTHEHNQASRAAITRLGAQFEGVILKDQRVAPNAFRNTAQFAITDDMWPQVKNQLEGWL
ncbi:GNAT family N-acetyltransferase [Pseudoalteromonas viridis]|uniref:GNAT family N-acetyltransferase n=1 Tax=Pseudoalteromonas viridis TaxID=339617 RepID=A0ABX7V951_9GAMM|nr:GNAT family protein [Pseudoalteromonas viridis]QTL37416.1 GNAT family N-acetyltransferase [Pseudoalteromonas viridis]